jgi:AcrR family transcriptional regulator
VAAGARERIQQAAVARFVADGYAGTSMDGIRRSAGVSNGSLYHFFPRKADLAAGLIVEGLGAYQQACLAALGPHRDAPAGIAAVVAAHLGWIEANADLARFLFAEAPDDVVLAAEPVLGDQNRRFVAALRAWLEPHQAAGTVMAGPWDVAHAVWFGPAQELSRQWLRGRGRTRPTRAAARLGAAAAIALTSPAASHSRPGARGTSTNLARARRPARPT